MQCFFHTPAAILRHLDSLGLFHVDMSLTRIKRALRFWGLTHPPFVTVHVLGTNGKGSTSAFLASLGQAHGCRVGLYTSPHFISPAERIRIGNAGDNVCLPWPMTRWIDLANTVMEHASDLTYFEFLTALALLAFRQEGVEIAVLEAGLGGRYDATTAVAADCLCYTPIAMDHRDVLGPTLADIAYDKASAICSPIPVCTVPQFPVAAAALATQARSVGATLTVATPVATDVPLGLCGLYQRYNAGLALAAWRVLAPMLGKDEHDSKAQLRGLAHAYMPGRMQRVPGTAAYPPLLLDGAHNPHGMAALVKALDADHIHPAAAVYACLHDKDWQPALHMLRRYLGAVPFFVVPLHNPRAAQADVVAAACNSVLPAMANVCAALPQALTKALTLPDVNSKRPVLVTGSLYLLAELFALYPHLLSAHCNA
ncbi:MAG: bifunctional folylpolyglutamate synthase/ dihydrofolate synthase [Desulfovibrio sp.]|nr:bifunctional folylpolyglutamate synthase/ dihydrofolate synthase [Desulfovibrio sp.]